MSKDADNPRGRAVVDAFGRGTVTVGETDISKAVTGFTVEAASGRATRIKVDLAFVTADMEAQVVIPADTAHALRVLGWNKVAHLASDLARVLEIEIPEGLSFFDAWVYVLTEAGGLHARMKGLEK